MGNLEESGKVPEYSGIHRNHAGNKAYRGRGWMTGPRKNRENRLTTTRQEDRERYGQEETNPSKLADCSSQAAYPDCVEWKDSLLKAVRQVRLDSSVF